MRGLDVFATLLAALGVVTQKEAAAIRAEAELAEKLQPLREQETIRAAVVTAKRHELDRLTHELDRLAERQEELKNQAKRLGEDQSREVGLAEEDAGHLADGLARDTERGGKLGHREMVVGHEVLAEHLAELLGGVQVWTHEPTVGELDGFAAEVEAADRTRE